MIEQKPEAVVSEALDRVTAALLSLAAETVSSASGHSSGEVTDTVRSRVIDNSRRF
jgi:hypothetical protein